MKSDRNTQKEKEVAPEPIPVAPQSNLDVNSLMESMRTLIKEELNNSSTKNIDQDEILKAIKNISVNSKQVPLEQKENNIDENILLKIHEKTINKLKQGTTEGSIKIEGKKQNETINTDELEGLL